MKACSKHLRSCCGDCLDKLKGDNYEVIIFTDFLITVILQIIYQEHVMVL
jgi:hypothetical protein